MHRLLATLCLIATVGPAQAQSVDRLTAEQINAARYEDWRRDEAADRPAPFLIRLQVLLDRAHLSPGVIDGYLGDNLKKAVETYRKNNGMAPGDGIDDALSAALHADGAPVIETYSINKEDLSGRFVRDVPEDFGQMAEMEWLGYRGPKEMLAERFHMDLDLMDALNPDADFTAEGAEILVTAPGDSLEDANVARVIVDRSRRQLFAYDPDGRMVSAYPATIGSDETPSPSGTHTVKVVVTDPSYSYRPSENFQQGDNTEPLEIPPGPNGPVGSVWIDLSKPTYGIHGTAEPEEIDKVPSHGCVRLTNWDAQELAKLVEPGTVVEFTQ